MYFSFTQVQHFPLGVYDAFLHLM